MKIKIGIILRNYHKILGLTWLIALFFLSVEAIWAAPVTEKQVQQVVTTWLSLEKAPFGAAISKKIGAIRPYTDQDGNIIYYIVFLEPKGLVIVAGDDQVEPIIGFVVDAVSYDPSDTTPLGALINKDLSQRIQVIREKEQKALAAGVGKLDEPSQLARAKWQFLKGAAGQSTMLQKQLDVISDTMVPPLVQSKWNQGEEGGDWVNDEWVGIPLYNYYTPHNYWSGCTATAMAQLMRYHRHPILGVGTPSFSIRVDDVAETRSLRGGDGNGNPYDWNEMPLVPDDSISESQRQAIGGLIYDVGVSFNMSYTGLGSSAGVDTATVINTFKYSNAISAWDVTSGDLPVILNTNLDAGFPVILSLSREDGGHTVVGDGYGYNLSTLYHHINMGWGGADDAWYNLPTVDDSYYGYTSISGVVYNVYPTGTGEIISGRVTDNAGSPLSGVSITALRNGGGEYSTITNNKGIYALAKVPSFSTYRIQASKDGYTFPVITASTQISSEWPILTGNYWGANFSSKEKRRVNFPWLFLLQDNH